MRTAHNRRQLFRLWIAAQEMRVSDAEGKRAMTGRIIRQGQYVRPEFAAEAYIGAQYVIIADADDEWLTGGGEYSADPADYRNSADGAGLGGMLVRRAHTYLTIGGAMVTAQRVIKSDATVGDLRRLARAATALVQS